MIADGDRELDAQLAAAAGVQDDDLPVLPDSFLHELRGERSVPEPASVLAARQLVVDAQEHHASGRRPRRRRAATVLAVAAVGVAVGVATLVVLVPSDEPGPGATAGPMTSISAVTPGPPDDLGPLEAPPGGLALAATDAVSFPYSLTTQPAGLTPVLGYSGPLTMFGYTSPAVWTAAYRSADDRGFTLRVSTGDPRILPPGSVEDVAAQTAETAVQVGGVVGDLVLGRYDEPLCGYAPATPQQTNTPDEVCTDAFAQLTWQRPDGMWIQVHGEGAWSTGAAVVGVGESVVDSPQPVPLQVRLAPAGWTVSSFEDNRSLTLTSDSEPTVDNRISVSIQERWRGYASPDVQPYAQDSPVEQIAVDGRPGELVSVLSGSSESPPGTRMWILEFALPDGLVVFMDAPDTLTHDQVLQVAAQVVYAP